MLQMSGCARLYPAVLSTFLQIRSVNRSELSLSALFSILFPLQNFPSILGIEKSQLRCAFCVITLEMKFYSWKSQNPKGDIHLYESTQLEIKTF